ncbi:MAG: pyridoxamine 5'-phosphate oxidase family protein [Lachnospiraceae bacterium]|nr:pyridoxamine 5'-phosphate oxidase family protein [Lachnospiraceae bacterium]
MFRDLVRKNRKIAEEECIAILREEKRGVLAVLGDEGYPYAVPINHWYSEEDGHLYFHSGKTGHKIDAIRNCDKASFCVYDRGYREEGDWALNIKSVIVFGRVKIVEDHERAIEITRKLSYKFTDDTAYIEREIENSGPGVLVFELIPEHMTGKLVNES